MKEGVKVLFNGQPYALLDFDKKVHSLEATSQNALVCLGTGVTTDKVFPDKGTTLARAIAQGGVYDSSSAVHICNFASSDVLFFCARNELSENLEHGLAQFILDPGSRSEGVFALASFTANNGDRKVAPTNF